MAVSPVPVALLTQTLPVFERLRDYKWPDDAEVVPLSNALVQTTERALRASIKLAEAQ